MSKQPATKQLSLLSFFKEKENRNPNAVPVDLTGDEETGQAVAAPVPCQEIIEVDSDLEDDVPACKKAKAVAAPVPCQEIIEVDSDLEDDVPACKKAKVGLEEQVTRMDSPVMKMAKTAKVDVSKLDHDDTSTFF